MPNYIITYTSSKSGACVYETTAKDMVEAVSFVVKQAKKNLVDLYDITVQTHNCTGKQKFCASCLVTPAIYGVKSKWYCKECLNNG